MSSVLGSSSLAILGTTVSAPPTFSAWPMACGAGGTRGLAARVRDFLLQPPKKAFLYVWAQFLNSHYLCVILSSLRPVFENCCCLEAEEPLLLFSPSHTDWRLDSCPAVVFTEPDKHRTPCRSASLAFQERSNWKKFNNICHRLGKKTCLTLRQVQIHWWKNYNLFFVADFISSSAPDVCAI